MKEQLLTFLFCVLSSVALAQRPDASNVRNGSKMAPSVGLNEQMLAQRIPVSFAGHDLKALIGAVERRTELVKKGEFESTSDFESRRKKAISGSLLGTVHFGDRLFFTTTVGSKEDSPVGLSYTYDADRQIAKFRVQPRVSNINSIGGPNVNASVPINSAVAQFTLISATALKRTYVGTNGFGVKTNIEESLVNRFGLISGPSQWLGGATGSRFEREAYAWEEWEMKPEQAARELPKLKALMVVSLVEPYIGYNFESSEPTRDSPYDIAVRSSYLSSRIEGVLFYSGITGEIFARFPEHFGDPSGAKLAQAEADAKASELQKAAALARLVATATPASIQAGRDQLTWTRSDNATDVGFNEAAAWCSGLGKGWQIPKVEDLLGLYDAKGAFGTTSCNSWTCKVSSEFTLSGMLFWSNTTDQSGRVALVDLESGTTKMSQPTVGPNRRALCVLKTPR